MPYTERFRLTPTIALAVLGSLAFVALAVFVPTPLIIRVLVVTVFSLYAAFSLAVALSHKIALRVDEAGVTLGGLPPRFFPWQDIEAIMLWQRYLPFTVGAGRHSHSARSGISAFDESELRHRSRREDEAWQTDPRTWHLPRT